MVGGFLHSVAKEKRIRSLKLSGQGEIILVGERILFRHLGNYLRLVA